jgi:hypothetical protein
MSGSKKFNIKTRMHLKPRVPRYISFEDDLIFDVMSLAPQYNDSQIRHVLLSIIRTMKNKVKEPECFAIATPLGEFYLKTTYMEKAKETIMSRVLEGKETRKMRDKIRRWVYKLQIYKAKRGHWADTYGIYHQGFGKKTYLHDQPSMSGLYPYTRKEREELQNIL